MRVFLDTESAGLVGPVKTVQFSIDDGPVHIFYFPTGWVHSESKRKQVEFLFQHVWLNPEAVVFIYNASHDVFKLAQLFHQWLGYDLRSWERPCPPPLFQCIDLQIHAAQYGPLSSFLSKGGRAVASLRRIPTDVWQEVVGQVEDIIRPRVPEVLGLKRTIHEVKDRPDLVTVSWATGRRISLKRTMAHLGYPTLNLADHWPLPPKGEEIQPHPYPQLWHRENDALCDEIMQRKESPFHAYAKLDIAYLVVLWQKLGCPIRPTDNDNCAQAVGYTRYHGFEIDQRELARSRQFYQDRLDKAAKALQGVDLQSPKQRVALLRSLAPPNAPINNSNKATLKMLINMNINPELTAAALAMKDYAQIKQRLNQVIIVDDCETGRMHLDFRVLGTATNRMAGASGLNGQGIAKRERDDEGKPIGLRHCVLLTDGGDFDSLEMTIMAAAYEDLNLQSDLAGNVKLHMRTACLMIPAMVAAGITYEDAIKEYNAGNPVYEQWYDLGKTLNFAIGYGAGEDKIASTLNIGLLEAQQCLASYFDWYKGLGQVRNRLLEEYCTADTERWTEDSVSRMKTWSESMFGWKRWYTFDAEMADTFWRLGKKGFDLSRHGRIVRQQYKGEQTYHQAVRSALYGAALTIQAAVMRQAGNQPIQTTGSQATKRLMSDLWLATRKPILNVHDELNRGRSTHGIGDFGVVQTVVSRFLEEHQRVIPLLGIKMEAMERWSDK